MKILVLAPHPFFQNRGTPIAVRMLVDVLSGAGRRVDVLTYHEGEDCEGLDATIHRIPALAGVHGIKPGFSWKKVVCDVLMMGKSIPLVRKNRYDLIHAVEESVFIAMTLKRLFGVPYVYDMDSSLVQQMVESYPWLGRARRPMESFERLALKGSLGVVAVCKALEEVARQCTPDKAILRLEDVSMLSSSTAGGENLRDALGIAGPLILYVGNLEKYQGIDLLLEAFRHASAQVPDAHLVVIGGAPDDIEKYRLRSGELGVGEKTHFTGPRPVAALAAYLSQADVLVSPRIQGQNTPMKIYSYLDAGAPVLATDLPTHTQVLDPEIALLAAPEPRAFADGLVALLRERDLREGLAGRARERVREEFSPEAFRTKLVRFYSELEGRLAVGT
ncbi:MAG: glycosyltransferase family 4 protein [Deferrisomatales bacterium]|nr:glycosyltransferase family 4 protein [Deferrisomatales bacterium]